MNGSEIKQRIDNNNRMIQDILNPNLFTLDTTIHELLKENERLQADCKHEFKDGICVYCYKEADTNEGN